MDTATQNQYYDSYAKVQVLTTSHRCKVRIENADIIVVRGTLE